jgi:hypothetical protein
MKLYSNLLIGLLLITLGLQADMKFKPIFSMDISPQPGVRIFDTGKGWLITSHGKAKFPVKVVSISDTGQVVWERSFANRLTSVTPHQGGAYLLDTSGNFFYLNSQGSIENNLTGVVTPGNNILGKSLSGFAYATGGDDSITCFMPDGDIEWIAQADDPVMNIYSIEDSIVACDKTGKLVKYNSSGEPSWELKLGMFTTTNPLAMEKGNLVYGLRDDTGKKGKVVEVNPSGKINWQCELTHGVNEIYVAGDGYLAIGSLHISALDSKGKFMWCQSFEQSQKLVPLGFNDDGRFVLGILNSEKDSDSLKITLLYWEGSISVVCKLPVKKNQFINAARRGNLVLIGEKEGSSIYQLITRKEYIEGLNK